MHEICANVNPKKYGRKSTDRRQRARKWRAPLTRGIDLTPVRTGIPEALDFGRRCDLSSIVVVFEQADRLRRKLATVSER